MLPSLKMSFLIHVFEEVFGYCQSVQSSVFYDYFIFLPTVENVCTIIQLVVFNVIPSG